MTRSCSLQASLFILIVLSLPIEILKAQDYTPVSRYYVEQSGGYSPLYNGKIPPMYNMLYEGTYFLESDAYYPGTVQYKGKLYVDLELNLNVHRDELYVRIPEYNSGSVLLKAHVESFIMGDMQFINIVKEKYPAAPAEGYYRVLYSGDDISVLKRTTKRMNSATIANDRKVTQVFEESISYYFLKNGYFHPVKNKSSVVRVLSGVRKELNRHIREDKLRFERMSGSLFGLMCEAIPKGGKMTRRSGTIRLLL